MLPFHQNPPVLMADKKLLAPYKHWMMTPTLRHRKFAQMENLHHISNALNKDLVNRWKIKISIDPLRAYITHISSVLASWKDHGTLWYIHSWNFIAGWIHWGGVINEAARSDFPGVYFPKNLWGEGRIDIVLNVTFSWTKEAFWWCHTYISRSFSFTTA